MFASTTRKHSRWWRRISNWLLHPRGEAAFVVSSQPWRHPFECSPVLVILPKAKAPESGFGCVGFCRVCFSVSASPLCCPDYLWSLPLLAQRVADLLPAA